MIAARLTSLLVVAGFLLAACDVGVQTYRASDDNPPSVGAFTELIEQGNVELFVAELNKVKRNDPDPETLAFLRSLWQLTRVDSPPALLQDDLVLVELAATLAQATRNRAIAMDEREFHEFIRSAVSSDDTQARRRALFALVVFDDAEDVPLLVQMASSDDEPTFRTVIVTLSSMCAPQARAALERMKPLLSGERLAFFTETLTKYEENALCPAIRA